jgi:hypothetical protein
VLWLNFHSVFKPKVSQEVIFLVVKLDLAAYFIPLTTKRGEKFDDLLFGTHLYFYCPGPVVVSCCWFQL